MTYFLELNPIKIKRLIFLNFLRTDKIGGAIMTIYRLSRRKFLIVAGSLTITSMAGGAAALDSLLGEERKKSKYRWAMFVDAAKCTECIRSIGLDGKPPCVIACDRENNVPEFGDKLRDPQWIKIIGIRCELSDEVIFFPLMCQHCEHPACAEVCLSKATFVREDGIVMIDYHRCIGCRYCIVACPFGVRSFNWYPPEEGLSEINPLVQTRGHGIVEKCTFCVERIDKEVYQAEREGRKPNPVPACVEACPYNALVFGNILDPDSEVYKMVVKYKPIRLRAELGTNPSVYYKL